MRRSLVAGLMMVTSAALAGPAAGASDPVPPRTPSPRTAAPDTTTPAAAVLTPTVLPGLGGSSASAAAVNDSGVVAGTALATDGRYYAVQWTGGRITRLPALGGAECQARDIDNSGRIVGGCMTAAGTFKPVMWDGGRLTRIPAPGDFGMAVATSKAGIVGTYNVPGDDPFQTRRAFLWRPGQASARTITAPVGASAEGINDSGRVVGTMRWLWADPSPLGQYRAWTWSAGTQTQLGTLGGGTTPNDINNAGQVVGTSIVTGSRLVPFIWSSGRLRTLPTGGRNSLTAQALNDGGVIVGTDGSQERAIRWASPSSPVTYLPQPSGTMLSQGQDVNRAGTVVGMAGSYDGSAFRFVAVVWK